MIVRLASITEAQAIEIEGKQFAPDSYLSPKKINVRWWLSETEVTDCVNPEFEWVNELELVELELPPLTEDNNENE